MDLVEAFVQFTADTKQFDAAVDHVHKNLTALKPSIDAIQKAARGLFLGLVGAGTLAAKAFGDAEAEDIKLRAALRASEEQAKDTTGQINALASSLSKVKGQKIDVAAKPNVSGAIHAPSIQLGNTNVDGQLDATMARLDKFARALQMVTVYDKDAVKGVMAFALNLGVTQENLEGVTKVGIGLAQEFFGGDLKAGVEAASKAYQGNFRELNRLIPGLQQAKTAQERWDMVVKSGLGGFGQATEVANSFNGSLKQLWNQTTAVAEAFGAALAPQIRQVTQFLAALAARLQSLTPAQTAQIVKWAEIAAGIAAVIAFGPKLISFAAGVTSAFVTVAKTLLSVGQAMIAGLFTPVGVIVAGFALLATGFAYLIGQGNSFTSKTIDGFVQIADFLDHLLGSWEGFKQGVMMIGTQLWDFLLEGFYDWKNRLLNGWEYVAEAIEQTWWSAFEGMYGAWTFLQSGAQKFINWLKNTWSNIIDYLADKFADWMIESDRKAAEKEIRARGAKKGKSEAQIQKEVDEDRQFRIDQVNQQRNRRDADKAREYAAKQKALDDEADFKVAQMHKQLDAQRAEDKAKREKNRADNDKEGDQALLQIEEARRKQLEDDMAKFRALPKLSDKIKAAWDELAKKLPFADGVDAFKQLQAEFDKLKTEAQKNVDNVKAPDKPGKFAFDKDADKSGKTIEEAFKEQIRRQLVGASLLYREEQAKKKAAEEQKKADDKLKKENTKALQDSSNRVNDNTKAVQKLTDQLANGIDAVAA